MDLHEEGSGMIKNWGRWSVIVDVKFPQIVYFDMWLGNMLSIRVLQWPVTLVGCNILDKIIMEDIFYLYYENIFHFHRIHIFLLQVIRPITKTQLKTKIYTKKVSLAIDFTNTSRVIIIIYNLKNINKNFIQHFYETTIIILSEEKNKKRTALSFLVLVIAFFRWINKLWTKCFIHVQSLKFHWFCNLYQTHKHAR